MPSYTDEQIITALRSCRGMVYVAANQLKCSPNTIKKRIEKSQKLKDVLEAETGFMLDTAELKLVSKVIDGDVGAIRYLLSCKGRDRGYGERLDVNSDPIDWPKVPQDILDAYRAHKISRDEVRRAIAGR